MKVSLIKNTKGFSQFILLKILMIFMTCYFVLIISVGLLSVKANIRKICFEETYSVQSEILKNTRQLFNLNKISTALRVSIKATKAAIAVNLAAFNFPAIPPLQQQLQTLEIAQTNLDTSQKIIITKNEMMMKANQLNMYKKISDKVNLEQQRWSFLFELFLNYIPKINFQYPIKPDLEGGVGPNYEWEINAEQKLTLVHFWHFNYMTNNYFQTLFKVQDQFQLTCGFKPNLKGELWDLQIITDKF